MSRFVQRAVANGKIWLSWEVLCRIKVLWRHEWTLKIECGSNNVCISNWLLSNGCRESIWTLDGLWSPEAAFERGRALGLTCPSHTYTYPSVEFTTTRGCSLWPSTPGFFHDGKKMKEPRLRGNVFSWDPGWERAQARRETGGGGRGDGLIHWLFI